MIKKGLKVKVLTGKDKKKEGEVIEVDKSNNRIKIKGVIFPKESFIHISNLKLIDEKTAKKKEAKK